MKKHEVVFTASSEADAIYLTMLKCVSQGMPITKTVQEATRQHMTASKKDIVTAGEKMGFKIGTIAVNYGIAHKGDDHVAAERKPRIPASEKAPGSKKGRSKKKGQEDLPAVGTRVKFTYHGQDAKYEGMAGQVISGMVTGLDGRMIIVLPDHHLHTDSKLKNRETWFFKDHLVK